MNKKLNSDLLLNQTKDLIWMVDHQLYLVYANKAYLDLMKEVTGVEKELNTPILVDGFGQGYIEKWRGYYERALSGDTFTIEEHFFHPVGKEMQYGHISFSPIKNDEGKINCVACRNTDVTSIIREKYRASSLMDSSLDVFCTIDEVGNFVYVSEAATKHWGYTPQELIGKPYVSYIIEEDIPKTKDIANAILNGEEIKSFVNRYKRKDGAIAYNQWSARRDKDAKLIYCVARDAKEKIEHENLLRQSELRFKALVQEGDDLTAILDSNGNYTYVSPTSFTILGIQPDELIGKSPFEFIHPEDAERTMASLQKITEQLKVQVEPFRFQNNKKEWRWVETVLTNMLDNPAVKGIVANSRDITTKKAEEQRLKLQESVITNTNDAVVITEAEPLDDPGPRIIYVNDAFTKMTGYTPEEVLGKSPRILQGPKTDKAELARLGKALRNWEPCKITIINYKKNGEEFWINFSVTPVANEKGWFTHWIAIERDVTVQKTEELKKDLVNNISDIFNQNIDTDLVTCLTALCKLIVKFGDFSFAEMWLPAIDGKTINCVTNYAESKAGNTFYSVDKNLNSLALGEGMPGYVWKNKKTAVWGDSDEKWDLFKRREAATKSGIDAMMGIPLKHNGEVIGILLLGTEKNKPALALHLELFQKLEATIATELNRKKIEIELAQIFNFTPDMICVAGFDGYLKRINSAGLALLGYSLEEMRSRPIKSFIHEEDRLLTIEKQIGLYNGENLRNFENRYLTKEGKIVWLSWTATSVLEHGIVYAVAKNITEEKKLRELNRQAGRSAKIGGWEFDLKSMTPYFTEETFRIYDLPFGSPPELEDGIKFYGPKAQPIIQAAVAQAIEYGTPYDLELPFNTAKGKNIWVRTLGNVELVDGKAVRLYGAIQDITDRKEAEKERNALLTTLEKSLNEIYIFDSESLKFSYVNKGALLNLGYSEQEIIALTPLDIKPEFTSTSFKELVTPLMNNEKKKIIFFTNHQRKDGSHYPVEVHLQLVIEGNNKRFLAIILDITARKKAEENLISTSERLRLATNAANIGVFDWDIKLNKLIWDDKMYEIFNVNPSEFNGAFEAWSATVHPEDIEMANKDVEDAISGVRDFDSNFRIVWKDKSIHYIKGNAQITRDSKGNAIRMIGTNWDITKEKVAEKTILLANERFEKVTEATNDIIWDWDIVNQNFYCSNAIDRLFGEGTAKSAKIEDVWKHFLHEEEAMVVRKSLYNALQDISCIHWEHEFRLITYDKKIVYIIDRARIIRDNKGKAVRLVGAKTDITEQKQLELQLKKLNENLQKHALELERSNEELEQFAFVASHDLQEPLRMISSFMDQLKRKYSDRLDEKALQYIHFATDGAKRMKQIILDLLLYSRANKPCEQKELINLNEIVSEYTQLRRKVIAEKKATITFQGLPSFETYRAPITQIFHCLLDNALKYVDEKKPPRIEISAQEKEKVWQFAIKDNGIGIDSKFYDKIFIIFQRLQNREEHDGTGIGLAIAKRSIEFLGGKIWLESELDKGSTFYFTILKIKKRT
mgnify:CR=1 FL=1